MESFLGKRYRLFESYNVNAFLDAIGVSESEREKDPLTRSTIQLQKTDEDLYVLTANAPFKKTSESFESGTEYTVSLSNQMKFTTRITVIGNTLHKTVTFPGRKSFTIDYKFSKDHVEIEYRVDDIVANRIYKLVK